VSQSIGGFVIWECFGKKKSDKKMTVFIDIFSLQGNSSDRYGVD